MNNRKGQDLDLMKHLQIKIQTRMTKIKGFMMLLYFRTRVQMVVNWKARP